MFQFWRCLTNQMAHPLGLAMADHPLFREQSYHALSRKDAVQWAVLCTYRA
jgi:hypothetical protein